MTPESKIESMVAYNLKIIDTKEEGGMRFLLANVPKQYVFCEITKDCGDLLYCHSWKQVSKTYNNGGNEFGMCVFEIVYEGGKHKISSAKYVLSTTEKGANTKPLKDAPNMSQSAREIIEKTVEKYNLMQEF